jgi:cell division protein FtsZ
MEYKKFMGTFGNNDQTNSRIKVIGVGGGGSNAVNYMHNQGIHGVSFAVCDTALQDLQKSPIEYKIQLGKMLTKGLGAGSKPEVGCMAAGESIDEIKAMLNPETTSMVFIVAGMGGGTDTGAALVIAKTAKDAGILTVAVVTIPYEYEQQERYKAARQGIEELKPCVDNFLIINNENISKLYGNLNVSEVEGKINEVICTAVRGIAEIMTRQGIHNVDIKDVESVMKDRGLTIMGMGRASGKTRAKQAAENAINSLLPDCKISNAKGLLLNVVEGSKKLYLAEMNEIITYIIEQTGENVHMKYGITADPSLGKDIAVTIIVTGFDEVNK